MSESYTSLIKILLNYEINVTLSDNQSISYNSKKDRNKAKVPPISKKALPNYRDTKAKQNNLAYDNIEQISAARDFNKIKH